MSCPCISIIVPVYNAREYLYRCIDSIIAQTLQSWELLLIDDGSTDESGDICDDYAEKDKRIRVVHQQNAGVSAARNTGLAVARGKYIGFVDSDDWIEYGMFDKLYCAAENEMCSIVMCDATTVYSNGKRELDTIAQLQQSYILSKKDFTPELLREMAGSVCRCLYRADLLKMHGIRFPCGIKFSEDRIFNILSIGHAEKIVYSKKSYYNRYVNSESAVHRFHADYFETCLMASEKINDAIELTWDDTESYQRVYLSQLIAGAFSAICNYYYKTSTLTSAERRAAVMRVCGSKELKKAIVDAGDTSLYAKLMLNNEIGTLIVCAKLSNLKHRR